MTFEDAVWIGLGLKVDADNRVSVPKRDWLDDIESQLDETVPYYVPRLIAEIRRLRKENS